MRRVGGARGRRLAFADRRDAGRQLAALLEGHRTSQPVVVGLARGGVPVAAEVARALGAPLDVLVVRKIGVPWQPELGCGAIAEGDVAIFNDALIADLGLRREDLEPVVEREREVLRERLAAYRAGRPAIPLDGREAIVIDDGLATGYTAVAGLESCRRRGARRVVLAVPVAPIATAEALRRVADEVVVVRAERDFFAIGEFYRDFGQTTDDEIRALLAAFRDAGGSSESGA